MYRDALSATIPLQIWRFVELSVLSMLNSLENEGGADPYPIP